MGTPTKRMRDRSTDDDGFKTVVLRLHDPASAAYRAELRRTVDSMKDDPGEAEILDWIEAVADTDGWR